MVKKKALVIFYKYRLFIAYKINDYTANDKRFSRKLQLMYHKKGYKMGEHKKNELFFEKNLQKFCRLENVL